MKKGEDIVKGAALISVVSANEDIEVEMSDLLDFQAPAGYGTYFTRQDAAIKHKSILDDQIKELSLAGQIKDNIQAVIDILFEFISKEEPPNIVCSLGKVNNDLVDITLSCSNKELFIQVSMLGYSSRRYKFGTMIGSGIFLLPDIIPSLRWLTA